MALAARLPALDLFLSDAAEEVLPIYGMRIEDLRRAHAASPVPELARELIDAWPPATCSRTTPKAPAPPRPTSRLRTSSRLERPS